MCARTAYTGIEVLMRKSITQERLLVHQIIASLIGWYRGKKVRRWWRLVVIKIHLHHIIREIAQKQKFANSMHMHAHNHRYKTTKTLQRMNKRIIVQSINMFLTLIIITHFTVPKWTATVIKLIQVRDNSICPLIFICLSWCVQPIFWNYNYLIVMTYYSVINVTDETQRK